MHRIIPLTVAVLLGLPHSSGMSAPEPPTPMPPAVDPASGERVDDARARRAAALRGRFTAAGVAYPPGAIFLRVFKQERELELWARGADRSPFHRVHVYPVQAASGVLGPKRREGDEQVPEGVYRIDRFNPRSRFHLSLGLDYPNASDLARTSDPAAPGTDIFIHGGAASIGCLAMGDPAIEELFLAALDARDLGGQRAIPVHVFPCRMTPANWRALLDPLAARRPELGVFWRELQPVYEAFDREKIPPSVSVGTAGVYRLE